MAKVECEACDGTGRWSGCGPADNMDVYEETCDECGGTGQVEETVATPAIEHPKPWLIVTDDGIFDSYSTEQLARNAAVKFVESDGPIDACIVVMAVAYYCAETRRVAVSRPPT